MKIVDADATLTDQTPAGSEVSRGEDTHAGPELRPEVLGDAAQRQTKAMIHAALFRATGEAPTVGPYQVLKLLGEGGMGVVYAAYDDKLERKVALKLIRGAVMRRPEGRARTLREARALARLSHPNVVHVYQVGEVDDEIYVAMEFLTGPTLRAWLAAQPRGWREVLAVFRQAGEGLAAAHRQGVIHRDFKPANVIVGDDGRVRVLDFGLAHFGEEGEARAPVKEGELTDVLLTQTGAVLGTPAYMAAEQFAGARGDAKTDQFSFCTALYEALYRQRPFAGDRLDALASAVRGGQVLPLTTRHDVPPWLHRVVVRGLLADPSLRWPSMDALLVALHPPEARTRWGRVAAVAGAAGTLLVGGVGYAFMRESGPPVSPASDDGQEDEEAAARGRAELLQLNDSRSLVMAKAAAASDPLRAMRTLSMLGGEDPSTWRLARFWASVAEARGLPARVMRAERELVEVRPMIDGTVLARDVLGAVWRWEMSGGTGVEISPAGSATQLLAARDAMVRVVIGAETAEVFGRDRSRSIALEDHRDWRLASDGRTLSARTDGEAAGLYLWDLTQQESAPRKIALASEAAVVIAEDASSVVIGEARAIRVVRVRDGGERVLRYRGAPAAISGDGAFVVATPEAGDGVMDVLEVATGRSRRVEADSVTALAGDEVLFTRAEHGRPVVRRESLRGGAVAWRLALPGQERGLVVDAANEQFAAGAGEAWVVGDLRAGALRSFVTVPKDSSPQWAGAGARMVSVDHEVRVHRPAHTPVQLRGGGASCGLAPGGRWAVVEPYEVAGEYARIELATGATTRFRCPERRGSAPGRTRAVIDDVGQVALFGADGWSCWWDERHGARTGAQALTGALVAGSPRGAALAEGAKVELWAGPEERAQSWRAAGPVVELEVNASGELLAARSEAGVEVLRVDDGAVTPVPTWSRPAGKAEVLASAMAWSPDGERLALLDKVEGSLELSVWDVRGEPREVAPRDHVVLGGHVLEDSPGLARTRMAFTPGGGAVALTNRHGSVMLVDLADHSTRRIEVPELIDLQMRSETDAVAVDARNAPYLLDFAVYEGSAITPALALGGAQRPALRRGEGGAMWACGVLGAGTVVEFAALREEPASGLRDRLVEIATGQ